jgi:hypothetical protein
MKNTLKAFVRFDVSGNIVPSSVILQKNKPKVGNWEEIESSLCCNQTTTTSTTTTALPSYTIGQLALGGVIAYILQEGDSGYNPDAQHGLVCSITTIGSSTWGCMGTLLTGANGSIIGTGAQNTVDIVAECLTTNITARLCSNLVEGGYSDWYLPSSGELSELYNNRLLIGNFNLSYWYYSSTQLDNNRAVYVNFSNGAIGYLNKSSGLNSRAVRSF